MHLEDREQHQADPVAYSIDRAAKNAGIGRSFLYLALNSGELRSLKIGKRRLVLRDDLLAWLKSKKA